LASNVAKQLAAKLRGRLVVVYGAEFLAELAHRWKTQLNENSKCWAFWEEFPELDHNVIVGYDHPTSITEHTHVVVLNGPCLSDRTARRIEVTSTLLTRHGVAHEEVGAKGKSRLAQTFSLIELGDFVSFYLALLNAVDPSTIEPIDYLRAELSKR
jgi:glucose/mannose-6-phosphate isomerase